MYNLLVANTSEAWNGDSSILRIERCIRVGEYTDKKIAEKYSDLSLAQIDEIIQFPCIFAYETQCHKDPKFGFIREITKRQGQGKVKITYDLIHLDKFLIYSEFEEMHFELDIQSWEYGRTHWAIKDVDLQRELLAKGIKLPKRDSKDELMSSSRHYDLDVALSFAGEDRIYADALAEELRLRGLRVFSYTYEKPEVWGKNLYSYLSDVYQNKAHYCVMFLSNHYAIKLWTNHEREAAQARAFEENEEYILPIRLDDTKIPGIPTTIAYLSWPPETPKTIADAIVEKLRKKPLGV